MKRLTQKMANGYHDTKDDNDETLDEIINRFGEIEDIEEEIGCELRIIGAALILGIHTKNGFVKPSLIWYYEWLLYDEETKQTYNPIEYGETWWLENEVGLDEYF